MLVATIIRDRNTGKIHVRYADSVQNGGNVEVIEILNGTEQDDLERRAEAYTDRLRLATGLLS